MKDEKRSNSIIHIKDYFYRTRWTIVIIGVIAFMTHGSILFSQRFGIDTDTIMNGRHNFLVLGRQGLAWLADWLGLEWYNLYYAQILTFVFVILVPICFGCLFYQTNRRNSRVNLSLLVLSSSFVVSPFWVAQMYFLNQSAQVLFACVLIAVSLFLTQLIRADLKHRWPCILLVLFLMNIIFACYQVLIVVYLTGAVMLFLLDALKEESSVRHQFRWIGFHAGCFLGGFFSYLAVARLFFMSSGGSNYLENQIAWRQVGVTEGLQRCISAIGSTLKNNPPYYSGGYGIYAILLLGVTVYWLITSGRLKKGSSVLILLAELFLIGSPYIFIVFYGGALMDRMQLVMPLSQGCMLYMAVALFPHMKEQKKTFLRVITGLAGAGFVLVLCKDVSFYMNYCNRFYYTDEWVFQYDAQIAQKVYLDIQEISASVDLEDSFDNYLFLGSPDIPYNATALRGETIGWSHFQYDSTVDLSRNRITYLMRNLGYPLTAHITDGEKAALLTYFEEYFEQEVDEMPSYPVSGYIKYLSNDELDLKYIVIKLGNSWRFY